VETKSDLGPLYSFYSGWQESLSLTSSLSYLSLSW